MKTPFGAGLFIVAAALICGCASRHAGPVYHAGDESPPDFLFGPVAAVLTNLNGFSTRITSATTTPEGAMRTASGELLGREGRLIFQPTLALKGKRAQTEGGLFFIWDETKHSGYVLSEALQGYAPFKSEVEGAGQVAIANEGIQENVNGHPCHRYEVVTVLNSGQKARLTLWRANDAGHFPVRIDSVSGLKHTILDFSEVRTEYPAQELFRPPDGFTAYASSVALMNELIVRDAAFARKNQRGEFDEPTDVRSSNWHQPDPAIR